MKKYILAFILIGNFTNALGASGDLMEDKYFSTNEPTLTPQEMAGVAIAKKWDASNSAHLKPVQGPDGSTRFLFGATRPSIVCAVLQVCDIELQMGEQVNSVNLGDSARWTVEPAISGAGDSQIQHILIKPMDVGLDTSLVIATTRRTYHLRLRSTRESAMSLVSFTYPEDSSKKWDILMAKAEDQKSRTTMPGTGENIEALNFNYSIDGNASWKPLRVYNDGKKTVIEMPMSMSQTEAPTLLVVNKSNEKSGEQTMVNYRLQNNRFIVDSVFKQAILIIGVGDEQNRITLTKED